MQFTGVSLKGKTDYEMTEVLMSAIFFVVVIVVYVDGGDTTSLNCRH
jgi:hypothetical protein